MSDVVKLTEQLMAERSLTPNDANCQKIIRERLNKLGFKTVDLSCHGVTNSWITHGSGHPILIFAGHTDVVPTGPENMWDSPPFTPTTKVGYLFGRGATDMKSGLAAMIVAAEEFVKQNPDHKGTIAFAITSDEEGPAEFGTVKIVEYLQKNTIKPEYCIVGEATSYDQLGDIIKIGRRGSMYGHLTIIGKQGHIAYPERAENPIHRAFKALDELTNTTWDNGNHYFPATQLQIYQINAGTGATNVIPPVLQVDFNFRFAPIKTAIELQQKCEAILKKHQLKYEIKWNLTSEPYFSGEKKLAQTASQVIEKICQRKPEFNTSGGTSDGRFIAKLGGEVIELGPVGKTAHHINEAVNLHDLEQLRQIYFTILTAFLRSH